MRAGGKALSICCVIATVFRS